MCIFKAMYTVNAKMIEQNLTLSEEQLCQKKFRCYTLRRQYCVCTIKINLNMVKKVTNMLLFHALLKLLWFCVFIYLFCLY